MKRFLLLFAILNIYGTASADSKKLPLPLPIPTIDELTTKHAMVCTFELSPTISIYRCENSELLCYTTANGGVFCQFKSQDQKDKENCGRYN